MTFGERLKQLRKANNLTQQEFADRLGIQRGAIAKYDTGASNPSDAVINLICREFRVSESWLRTGEGEMRVPVTREQEIAAYVGKILGDPEAEFPRRLIAVMASMKPEEMTILEKIVDRLAKENTGD